MDHTLSILLLVLVALFVLVVHLTLVHPLKDHHKKYSESNTITPDMLCLDLGNILHCGHFVLTAGPGMPRRPSGPGRPGDP